MTTRPFAVRFFLLPFLWLAALTAARAQAPDPWMGEGDYRSFHLTGDAAKDGGMSVETFDTPAGKREGFRFTVRAVPERPLAIQALAANDHPVAAGDVLFAHFYMRVPKSDQESGEGKIQFILEDGKTYDKSVQLAARTVGEWKEFNVPFAAKGDYQPGSAHIIFRLGYYRQTVEIAGFEVVNYHATRKVSSLPITLPDLSYAGMEPNAAWRGPAAERIRRLRMAPLTVEVLDAQGRPVSGAAVEIAQTRHAFWFGTAVSAQRLVDDATFSDAVRANFNLVTLENDLKWGAWDRNKDLPLRAARWCQEHDLALRGHNMVWPGWRHLPPSLKEMQSRPDDLRRAVLHHVEEIGTALAPYTAIWDVVNEPYDNHDLIDLLGPNLLGDIFRQAKAVDPRSKLYINDYGIVTGGGLDRPHQENYAKHIRELLAQHAPVEGIGIQGHFGQEFTPPEKIFNILDDLARFNLPVQMTEFTAQADDREMDAKVLRDVLTVFFSHPSVDGFIFWGFYEGRGFEHKATLLDADGQLTPAGKVYRDLVYHQWWTHANTATGQDGKSRVDGFRGRYEVTVSHGGKTFKKPAELTAGGSSVTVRLTDGAAQ